MRKAVDFPQPEGPRSDTNSPGRMSRSRPASAVVPLAKVLPTPRMETRAAVATGRSRIASIGQSSGPSEDETKRQTPSSREGGGSAARACREASDAQRSED